MQNNEIWYHFLLFTMLPESDLEHGGPEEDVTDAWGNGPKTGGGGLMSINICDRTIQVRHVDMTEVLANIENNPETEENEEKKE